MFPTILFPTSRAPSLGELQAPVTLLTALVAMFLDTGLCSMNDQLSPSKDLRGSVI